MGRTRRAARYAWLDEGRSRAGAGGLPADDEGSAWLVQGPYGSVRTALVGQLPLDDVGQWRPASGPAKARAGHRRSRSRGRRTRGASAGRVVRRWPVWPNVVTAAAAGVLGWYALRLAADAAGRGVDTAGLAEALVGVAVGCAALKMMLSTCYRPRLCGQFPDGRVAVVIPVYNEDPELLRLCLESVCRQSRQPDEIWVIDDGSRSTVCLELANELFARDWRARVHRLAENAGKRHAQAWALRRTSADIIVTVDSDTVLEDAALEELVRPLSDSRIQGVTSYVRVLNTKRTLLTRLTALRYANAFLWEREAYAAAGAVLCCCGSLSAYRGDLVRDNLDDYVNQVFLGRHVMYGDDRRLTNYGLQRGRVAIQATSIASTMVPERLGHYLRQQNRWNKSFFRESLWALHRLSRTRPAWWFTLAELGTWILSTVGLCAVLVALVALGQLPAATSLQYLVLISYVRSVRYLACEPQRSLHQITNFLLAPLYGILHLCLLTPLRFYSLCTLRHRGWGTRGDIEVRTTQLPESDKTPVAA
jgi:hyaluronan synthase